MENSSKEDFIKDSPLSKYFFDHYQIKEMARKFFLLFAKNIQSQKIHNLFIIILTSVIALATVAYVLITASSVSTMNEANKLQEQKIDIDTQMLNIEKQKIEIDTKLLAIENEKIEINKNLNQPFCGIKDVTVVKERENIIKISMIIKNYGNYVAKNAAINWKFYRIKNLKEEINTWKPIKTWQSKGAMHVSVMPKNEFKRFLLFVKKGVFNKLVEGYESAVGVGINIEYKKMNNKSERYSYFYIITRLLTDKEDTYEANLQGVIKGE